MKRVGTDGRAKEPVKGSIGVRPAETASQRPIFERLKTQNEQISYEFTNNDTIILRNNGMFYKAMGNSVVILKELGVTTKAHTTYSAAYKQDVFEMSFYSKTIEKTKELLKEKCGKVLRDDELFFIIRLNQPMNSKKIQQQKKSGAVKIEATQNLLTRQRKDTPLAKEVRELFKEAALLTRTMKGTDGEVLAKIILETIMKLQGNVRAFMRDEKSDVLWHEIENTVDDLQGLLLHVPNLPDQVGRLSRMGDSLNKIVNRYV